jgi:glycosyltransferase involved in cell wall biosynthesis
MSPKSGKKPLDQTIPRILLIGHAYIVGVNQQKIKAIENANRVKMCLLVPKSWPDIEWGINRHLEQPDFELSYYPAKVWFAGRSGAYLYNPFLVMRVLSAFRPNLIQVEQEAFSLSAFEMAIFARFTQIPLVIFCWENEDRQLFTLRKWTRQFVLKTVRWVIAGNNDANKLMQKWGYNGPITIMPEIGIDPKTFSPSRNQRMGQQFTIGFIGRLVHEKAVDLLLEAGYELKKRGLDFRFIICGTGPEENALQVLAGKMNLESSIRWHPAVRHDKVPNEIAQMDVLVLPSRTLPGRWKEQFGHVLIEAMSMGIPVIGSSSGAIPDVIGRSDLIFPENDSKGLATILERLIVNQEWREIVAAYGLERVQKEFTHEAIAQKLLDIWSKIL